MSTSMHSDSSSSSNVVDLFSGKTYSTLKHERFIRLSPEYDGLCMLYSTSQTSADKFYTMKILCWGIRENGEVVGLVPWLNKVVPCDELNDTDLGLYEGYYDLATEQVFYTPPAHKIMELETASNHSDKLPNSDRILQEIPDGIGTHAMLTADDEHSLILTEVVSWRLMGDGKILAMLIDEAGVDVTPVLPGDNCLYPAKENPNFRYFFQYRIANQLKSEDPEAMAAIALLFDE
ncbi:hypothetical protein [Oceanicoccus sp. KOV_DT_Chl]|uniref:hypothetical protein n=1 Tax=Oceanicoccus sp. KOV_DT_Chl TaxID=1904639 RepID=UPI000C7DE910|nr:hypothetical protein [Oceanicoccus sp. KOV_DT_Chl]